MARIVCTYARWWWVRIEFGRRYSPEKRSSSLDPLFCSFISNIGGGVRWASGGFGARPVKGRGIDCTGIGNRFDGL